MINKLSRRLKEVMDAVAPLAHELREEARARLDQARQEMTEGYTDMKESLEASERETQRARRMARNGRSDPANG